MAHFRTAADQYVLPIDVKVAVDLYPGDLVVLNTDTNTITKASGLSDATHMVALTDETIGGGYVPVDLKVYKPTGKVAASTSVAKKVGLYPIFDKGDIIV